MAVNKCRQMVDREFILLIYQSTFNNHFHTFYYLPGVTSKHTFSLPRKYFTSSEKKCQFQLLEVAKQCVHTTLGDKGSHLGD